MTALPLVVLSEPLPADWTRGLEGRCELRVGLEMDAASAARVRGILTMLTVAVDAKLLAAFPQLQVVSNMAVGYDNIDLQACRARGLAVGNTPGVLTDATADLAMGLILACARGFEAARRDAAAGEWGPWSPTGWLGLELRDASLGIVGLGAIGAAVAQRARAFGMRIAYSGPRPHPERAEPLEAEYLPLDALLERCDVVSLHCPLNAQTRGLIGAEALRRIGPRGHLVNTARGPVVDSAALVDALRNEEIAGVALDVTDPEPLPPAHPLYEFSRCLVLPHLGSATTRTRKAMAQRAVANLLAGIEGRPLPSAVELAVG